MNAKPPLSHPDVSVLVVNYHCGTYLARCLETLFQTVRGVSFEALVVDNASTDDSVALARQLNLPVEWICLKENIGFARANNLAARQACGEYLLLLNPDTELRQDSITPLVNYLRAHPEVGIVGGHHEDGQGQWQRNFGLPVRLWLDFEYAFSPQRFWNRLPASPPESPVEVGWLAGSFLMISKKLADRIGLFDEDFFLNDEDIDLAARVRQAGLRVMYHPARGLRHFGGISKAQTPGVSIEHYRSRRHYYGKYHSPVHQWLYTVAYQLRCWRDAFSEWKRRSKGS